MQAEPSSRTRDQHDTRRADLSHAKRRAHAGADGASCKRCSGESDLVWNPDRILGRYTCELGIATCTMLSVDMTVATEVMAPTETMATAQACNTLIDGDPVSNALSWYGSSRSNDLAGDLVARGLIPCCSPDQTCSRKHIMMADPGGLDAKQYAMRAGIRSFDAHHTKFVRPANIAQSDRLHHHVIVKRPFPSRL